LLLVSELLLAALLLHLLRHLELVLLGVVLFQEVVVHGLQLLVLVFGAAFALGLLDDLLRDGEVASLAGLLRVVC